MQAETIEIEEIEITGGEAKIKKEYEKILIKERNRELNMKAQNLVKLGCFDQREETNIDFSLLDKVTYGSMYRKIYDLYMDKDGNLFYIFGKIEGENAKPYAYDVIAIETVSDEDYKKLYKAHSFEGAGFVKGLYIAALVMWITIIAISASIFIYYLVQGLKFFDIIIALVSLIFNVAVLTCCLAITNVTYRKYIGK